MTWSPLNAAPAPVQGTWADPKNASVLIAFTDSGLYRSADSGATWTASYNGTGSAVSPDGTTLYTSDYQGLHESTDGGATWSAVTNIASGIFPADVISINPANTNDVVVVNEAGTVGQSSDGGKTFSVEYGVTNAPQFVLESWLKVFTDASGDILVTDVLGQSVARSTDRGKTWTTPLTLAPFTGVAQAPGWPSTLYVVGAATGIYKSTDFGTTWTQVNSRPTLTGISVSAASANTITVVDWSGDIWTSTDGGVTLTPKGSGSNATGATSLAAGASKASRLYMTVSPPNASFISRLDSNLTSVVWSSYYGSAQGTTLTSVAAIPGSSDVWVAGSSNGYAPVTQITNVAGDDAVLLARVSDATPTCRYVLSPQSQYVYTTETISAALEARAAAHGRRVPMHRGFQSGAGQAAAGRQRSAPRLWRTRPTRRAQGISRQRDRALRSRSQPAIARILFQRR